MLVTKGLYSVNANNLKKTLLSGVSALAVGVMALALGAPAQATQPPGNNNSTYAASGNLSSSSNGGTTYSGGGNGSLNGNGVITNQVHVDQGQQGGGFAKATGVGFDCGCLKQVETGQWSSANGNFTINGQVNMPYGSTGSIGGGFDMTSYNNNNAGANLSFVITSNQNGNGGNYGGGGHGGHNGGHND